MKYFFDTTIKSINQKFDNYELTIVIPIYNEQKNISEVLQNWNEKLKKLNIKFCFILINDGSSDNSIEIIKSLNYEIILIDKHNSGHGRSIRLGYDFSLKHLKSDYILQIDSDGQCDSKYFQNFWNKRKDYDFILGIRKTRGDGLIRYFTSKISLLLTSILTYKNLKDPNTPYRLFKKHVLREALLNIKESFDIQNIAITYVILKKKYKFSTVEISFPNRIGGENSINFLRVFQMGLNMLFDLYFLKIILR